MNDSPRKRLNTFRWILVFSLAVIFLRVVQIQFVYHTRLDRWAKSQDREIELKGPRGKIRDREGRELAISVESMSFFADPEEIDNVKKFARRVGPLLKIPQREIEVKLKQNSDRRFVWLKRQVEPKLRETIEKQDLHSIDGLGAIREFRREYPHGDLLNQLLGRVSIDGEGIEGLERDYDKDLRAGVSVVRAPRDARGRLYYVDKDQLLSKGEAGKDLTLTIDVKLQSLIEEKIDEFKKRYEANTALAIVVDPATGELLALAQSPRIYSKDGRPFRNLAATDPIEPGSVVKPLYVAWGLERNIVHEKTEFDIPGGTIQIGDKIFKDPEKIKREHFTPEEILKYSSNVGAIKLGQALGFREMWSLINKIGFNEKSGLGLASESRGILKEPRENQKIEQATMAFGQGFAITPLQLVRAFTAIAGDGFLHPLKIQLSNVFHEEDAAAKERVFSPKTLERIHRLMEAALSDGGTATHARVEGYTVAGKTGTSQKTRGKLGYDDKSYWASFVGYFPSEDPRYLIYVAFDDPKGKVHLGGLTAAPLFSEIAKLCLRVDEPVVPTVASATNENFGLLDLRTIASTKEVSSTAVQGLVAENNASDTSFVPTLTGMQLTEAMRILQNYQDLDIKTKGRGTYIEHQFPSAGTPVKKNNSLVLFLK